MGRFYLDQVVMQCNKFCIRYVLEDLFKLVYIKLLEYDRKFSPIKDVIKWQVIIIGQYHCMKITQITRKKQLQRRVIARSNMPEGKKFQISSVTDNYIAKPQLW